MTIVRRQITPNGVFSQAAYDAVFPFIQHLRTDHAQSYAWGCGPEMVHWPYWVSRLVPPRVKSRQDLTPELVQHHAAVGLSTPLFTVRYNPQATPWGRLRSRREEWATRELERMGIGQPVIWGDLHQWRSWNRMHGLPRVVPHSDIPGVFIEGLVVRHHSVMPMMEVT